MKHVLAFVIIIILIAASSQAQLSGIYVEFYNPTAPFNVAPDGWQTVSGYPCRHGPDPDNDGIPSSIGTAEPGLSSGSGVSLSSVNSVNYRIFAVDPTSTDIGNVSVSGSSTSPTLFIGRPAGGFPIPSAFGRLPSAGSRNLGRISQSGVKLRLQGFIEGTLNNTITAHEIVRFDFGTATSSGTGTIAANISHNPSADPSVTQLGGLFAKRVAPGAVITSYNSNIRVLQTYSDFEGSVETTDDNNIESFVVGRDFKGIVLSDGNINSLQVIRNGTGSITAVGSLGTGTVSGHWGAQPSGSTPNYQSSSIAVGLIATSLSVTGDFVGHLEAGSINQLTVGGGFYNHASGMNAIGSVLVGGNIQTLTVGTPTLGTATGNMLDLEADSITSAVTLAGNYVSGSTLLRDGLPAGSVFRIGGDLASSVMIDLENDPLDASDVGLMGQIVVNQSNGTGDWIGNVRVDDGSALTTLASNYTTLSNAVGGGAVGLAPFNFHQFTGPLGVGDVRDCNPYQTELVQIGACVEPGSLDQVVIDHYGPVFAQGAEDQYRIEFRPETTPSSWSEVTDLFVVDTTQTATSGATTNRKVFIKPAVGNATGFSAPGWYRFRPLPGKIRCANVTGNPDVAYDSNITSGDSGSSSGTQYDWYQFRVRLAYCPGGFAFEGGQVNATDIAQWMEEPFEVNCDGQICEQDLADMLSAYNN